MSELLEQSLASIVSKHHEAAVVFEKYELDFCCKGKRSLQDACDEHQLQALTVAEEIIKSIDQFVPSHLPFTEMTAEELINYIVIHHHFYVKQTIPVIFTHLEKVAYKHGERFPFMIEVYRLFAEVRHELTDHLYKEETILFPRIKQLGKMEIQEKEVVTGSGYIQGPVQVMEMEHDHAGDLLQKIRHLTNNYTPPAGACTTFRLSLEELKAFEEDLHKHVHLENHILFPKALQMQGI
ncbi:MAG: iron-sulfur cluster repair di-iron protein [Bacteroidota bacterium]|nr:iron-sulfur cluster repair di-iron protein [Bacteroidota bacterium]